MISDYTTCDNMDYKPTLAKSGVSFCTVDFREQLRGVAQCAQMRCTGRNRPLIALLIEVKTDNKLGMALMLFEFDKARNND
jgi:hypothetical protein